MVNLNDNLNEHGQCLAELAKIFVHHSVPEFESAPLRDTGKSSDFYDAVFQHSKVDGLAKAAC
ncbi:MAG: hypothetical protein ABL885_01940 [Methylophilaceae bacterium]